MPSYRQYDLAEGPQNDQEHGIRQTCGKLCKNLTPQEQREIIQAKIREEYGCLMNKANFGRSGEKKYLISAIWWREWCDYVNFDWQSEVYEDNLAFKINNNLLLAPNEVP